MPGLTLHDFYIGSTINILGRLINIIGYGDEATCNAFKGITERCVLICPQSRENSFIDVIRNIEAKNFRIINLKMTKFSFNAGREFLQKFSVCESNLDIVEMFSQDKSMCIEVIGPGCAAQMVLDYQHQVDKVMIFDSGGQDGFLQQSKYIFDDTRCLNSAVFHASSLLIVKPHVIKHGLLSEILSRLSKEGYVITAATMLLMSRTNSDEFLEVYKGVLSEFMEISNELCNGRLVALELTKVHTNDANNNEKNSSGDCTDTAATSVQQQLRQLCGPFDPECAKRVFPCSLRALYGKTIPENAVHCTDLPEDIHLELEYFFKILQKSM